MKKELNKRESKQGNFFEGKETAQGSVRKLSSKKARLGRKRLKDYGKVLLAKQLLRALYNNPREKIFQRYFGKEKSMNEALGKLSSRLEIVLTAMGGAVSNGHARQLINHGKISVNGHIVKERGYLLKDGDIVASSVKFVNATPLKTSSENIPSSMYVASVKPPKIPGLLKLKTPVFANLLVNAELNYGIYYSKEISTEHVNRLAKAAKGDQVGFGWKNTNVKAIKNLLLELKTAKEEDKMKICAIFYNLVQAYYSRVR